MNRCIDKTILGVLVASAIAIFFARAYTMQPALFQNEAIRLYWYDLVDSFCWFIAYAVFYLCTFFVRHYKLLSSCARISITGMLWMVFWNFNDEYRLIATEYNPAEHAFFIFIVAYAIIEIIFNVKRKTERSDISAAK